ncbi:hypothetical protein BOTBODRAFT_183905 [Botryobasidium botryosum FD-172 SS1]|uniref:CP-type G domain-containing protein n=1 Tax=Botryobasidium botryosum (strain FD-172 SS1) TaxID=930990 RepID=A0A067N6Z9_BOTB1|nr:hypothetical protein BOTBODRAFT_183905 [Botryobasidium botryosum FD-172 SS1]
MTDQDFRILSISSSTQRIRDGEHAKVLPKSRNKVGLGRAIINKRARDARTTNESTNYSTDLDKLKSVTQEKDLDEFLNTAQLAGTEFTAEKQNIKVIQAPGVGVSSAHNPFLLSQQEEEDALRKHSQYRTSLRVPRRPPWTKSMNTAELERQEREAFLEWRRKLAELQEKEDLVFTPFERNIEVWRQLWRVLERSHLVVQIVDARNPLRFRCEDLESYVSGVEGAEGEAGTGKGERKSLLLINKSDLLSLDQRKLWADYFDTQGIQYAFFSAANAQAIQEARRAAELAAQYEDASQGSDEESEEETVEKDVVKKLEEANLEDEQADSEDDSREHLILPGLDEEVDDDPRTRVLSVLELEDLFIKSAPDLSLFVNSSGSTPERLVVGLVGYPNVGKSSTINSLLGEKKVSVSATPGKTKHFQTINLSPSIMLCDCPGLVFPQFATSKAELVCDGVLPIDQLREHTGPVSLLVQRVPAELLEATYGLKIKRKPIEEGGDMRVTAEDFLIAYAIARGFARAGQGNPDESRAARYVLKDFVNAKLLYCHPPPDVPSDTFNKSTRELALRRLEMSGKKLAPTTRVGKGADTFVTPASAHPQMEAPPQQSSRSRALDENFFESGTSLSARPFVQGGWRHGQEISRATMFPHQQRVANDGTVLPPSGVHFNTREPGAKGKKHFKGTKHVKARSGKGYDLD